MPQQKQNPRWWLPGIVVVEFDKRLSPEVLFPFHAAASHKDLSWLDTSGIRLIVGDRLVKPPKWTFSFAPHESPAVPDYERFVTFYLQEDVNVPAIAKELSQLRGIVRADGEPKLSPPIRREARSSRVVSAPRSEALEIPLFDEPLAVTGGEPLGVVVSVGMELLQNQWYLFRCKADSVLQSGIRGEGVVVAAVDWGVNVAHQEFQNNRIAFRYNATDGSENVSSGPFTWHGTATLGLIGAGDNDMGMLGFAPDAELWAIQAQDSGDNIDNGSWASAIETARTHDSNGKRKVILVEASTDNGRNVESSTLVRIPIRTAINQDNCVVVVAAGDAGVDAGLNENEGAIPATGSILVGATQYREDPTVLQRGFSNCGARIVVSAPGDNARDVTCCECGIDTYRTMFGGTSGAAAKVAGAMALLLQEFPQVTNQQIEGVLRDMTQIPTTAGREIGTFLDIPELLYRVSQLNFS